MKRFLCLLFSIVMMLAVLPFAAFAEGGTEQDPFEDITTPHLLLMEAETGAVMYERKGYEKAYPASTTKLMTAILAAENIQDMSRVVTVGWRAVSGFGPKSSLMGLKGGEEIALIDVLHGLMMRSGNDAAKELAIETVAEVYGDAVEESDAVDKFLEMMNDKAAEIGMVNTHFATVDGRHNEEHYTTAYDFALLMQYVLKNELVSEVISTVTYDIPPNNKHSAGYHLENSNKLICKKETDTTSFLYEYCIGGKTGETNQAGYCLASASKKDDVTLILIQFGDSNANGRLTTYRYKVAKEIYDWGFSNYGEMTLEEIGVETEFTIQTTGYSPFDEQLGKLDVRADIDGLSVKGIMTDLYKLKAAPDAINVEIHIDNPTAPINEGDLIGHAEYYIDGVTPISAPLYACRSIAAAAEIKEQESPANININNTPPPDSGEIGKLRFAQSAGGSEYSVWVYYENSLYNMTDKAWYYVYCSDGLFRISSAPEAAKRIVLYKQMFDSEGQPYYSKVDSVGDGGIFIITSDGYALSSEKADGTLKAVLLDETGDTITSDVIPEILWKLESNGNGYKISQSSKYLTRDPGSGMVFWIVVGSVVLFIVILIMLIAQHNRTGGYRKRRRRNRSRSLRTPRRRDRFGRSGR